MPIVWTENPEANRLLETDPLALLIGLVLDQQVKMEKAFAGPYELKQRLGHLDAGKIAASDPDKLITVFRERPALHRFPGSMAQRVQALCQAIVKEFQPEFGQRCMEILGPLGIIQGGEWAPLAGEIDRIYRRSFGNHAGGTSQVKRMVVATRVLGLPR